MSCFCRIQVTFKYNCFTISRKGKVKQKEKFYYVNEKFLEQFMTYIFNYYICFLNSKIEKKVYIKEE